MASSIGDQRDSGGILPGEGEPAHASEDGPGRKSGLSTGGLLKYTSCLLSLAMHSDGWALSGGPTSNLPDSACAEPLLHHHIRNSCATQAMKFPGP